MRLGVEAAFVAGELVRGDVEVDVRDGRISAVGLPPAGGARIACAGFVDLQVNGFAGVDFTHAELDGVRASALAMARTGVTSFLLTIPSAPADRYDRALAVARAAMAEDIGVAGVHLEGPFLSPARAGAHPLERLLAPDLSLVERWGPVAMMTLAPELPGGLDLVRALVARGTTVAVGHSDADAATCHAAYDAGARCHTHVWNATPPLSARAPGPAGVALTRPDVVPCLIADLVHVGPETLALSTAATADRYAVVTDAVAPASLGDGGGVRLADGTIAGSTSTMDQSVRNLVALGRPLPEVLAGVTSRPAALVGREASLRIGAIADITVLADDLTVTTTLRAGLPAAG